MIYEPYLADLRSAVDRLAGVGTPARPQASDSHWWITLGGTFRDFASRLRGPRIRRSVRL